MITGPGYWELGEFFDQRKDAYRALMRDRLTEWFAARGDDMARPTLTVGYMTIIGQREIDAYQAKVAALAAQKDAPA